MNQIMTTRTVTIHYGVGEDGAMSSRQSTQGDLVWVIGLDGKVGLSVDSFEFRLQEGESHLVEPGQTYRVFATSEASTFVSIRTDATRFLMKNRLSSLRDSRLRRQPSIATEALRLTLGDWATRLFLGGSFDDEIDDWLQAHLVSTGAMQAHIFSPILRFIEREYANPIRIDTLSQMAFQSKYQFIRNFRAYTGLSPYQYITRQRLIRAKELLRYSEFTLLEISIEVGFGSTAQLNKHFTEWVGCPPRRFRENTGHRIQR